MSRMEGSEEDLSRWLERGGEEGERRKGKR